MHARDLLCILLISSFLLISVASPEPSMSRYELTVRKLYQVNMWHPVKLGLENIERLHGLLGNPMQGMPIIHIAGTNGKGSVAWKISKALQAAGYRTGLFVSPHLACFRERMQVRHPTKQ